MITVADIIRQLRIEEKDVNEVKYSDWDIINALNKAMRLIANRFAMTNSDFMLKMVSYSNGEEAEPTIVTDVPYNDMTLAEYALPDDYVAVDKVLTTNGYEMSPSVDGVIREGQYLINGNKLYVVEDVIFWYRYAFPTFGKGDLIELPTPFFDFVVNSVKYLLNEDFDTAAQFIADNAMKMIPARKYTHAKQKLAWRI